MNDKAARNPGGRPPKFEEKRRPVTMTLPVRILDDLEKIDPDRAKAVVKATEAVVGGKTGRPKPVELVEMAPGKSLIVIGLCRALKEIPWLRLIEIVPTRFLLTIPPGTPIEALEVALRDLSSDPGVMTEPFEVAVLGELIDLIGHHRRSLRLSKAEVLIIGTA
jgi:hypothetical protein